MPRWNYTIDIKDEWDLTKKYGDKVPRVELKKLVDLVHKLIQRLPENLLTWNLLDALDLLEESVDDNVEEFADLDLFNEGWNQLYDWADYNRVWIKTII